MKFRGLLFPISLAALLAVSGCSKDYLNVTSNELTSADEYFSSQSDAIALTNAVYVPLTGMYNGCMWQIGDVMADDTQKGGGGPNDGVELRQLEDFSFGSTNPLIMVLWTQCYQGIQRANVVIQKVPGIPDMDANIRDRCIGEATTLRAYYYFQLVRSFGDVPLFTDPITLSGSASISRSPASKVYEQIVKDLKAAAVLLPDTRYTAGDVGRLNKWAAKGLLASVYLTIHDKENAAKEAKDVIGSGLYSLNTNYKDNFDVLKENGPESLFEAQFKNNYENYSDYTGESKLDCFFAPRGALWDDNSSMTPSNGYGFNIPTPEVAALWEKNSGGGEDKRRFSTMWIPGDIIKSALPTAGPNKKYTQKPLEGSPNGFNISKYFIEFGYNNGQSTNWGWSSAQNVPILRYSEILLIAAEASGKADGIQYANQVRDRAGLAPLSLGLNDNDYLEAIYKERRLEFLGEMHRWWDLLRHPDENYFITQMQKQNVTPKKTNRFLPIPQSEIDKNSHLKQNDGY